ncbi:hypothetical protein MAR_005360, partial [Mya arenaria]
MPNYMRRFLLTDLYHGDTQDVLVATTMTSLPNITSQQVPGSSFIVTKEILDKTTGRLQDYTCTMAILKMFVLVFTMMTSFPIVIGQQVPGSRVIVTKEIIDKINDWEIARLREDLLKANINEIRDDKGHTTWKIF